MIAGKTARRRAAAVAFAMIAACGVEPPLAPDANPLPPEGEAPASGGATGRFTGLAGHAAGGGVTFSVNGDVGTIAFADDFTSTRVPDPHVYLNTTTDANRGTPLRVATLVSPTGAQTYTFRLPTGISYTHVLVWCDRYNVGVGAARVS
ncbi:MAG: DM13 domain-containing protein [Gemmatimonadales bacterium]